MPEKKKVLICPLNWGLGHATRDVPIIRTLLVENFEVVAATSGDSFNYLRKEFPNMLILNLTGYKVKYSRSSSLLFQMFLVIPKIIYWTYKEHKLLKQIIFENDIDIVISDNRFGLWNKTTYNIFITHQLNVKFPGWLKVFEPVYKYLSTHFIKRFNECWIPDFEGDNNLSGRLSHVKTKLKRIYFINPLSRFSLIKQKQEQETIDVLFILSGPEPQRSIFERIILNQVKNSALDFMIVRGTTNKRNCQITTNYIDMADTEQLYDLILRSKLVICRSGYSSVMDMVTLKKKAVLVPTPGQTEQEYLANYLFQKGFFYTMKQKDFELNKAINNSFNFPEIETSMNNVLYKRILKLK